LKRHFNKIIIGILFLCISATGIIADAVLPKSIPVDKEKNQETGEIIEIPKDYKISKSVRILVNDDNYVHIDETTVKGTLKEIVYNDGEIKKLIIESIDDKEYAIDYKSLDLISIDLVKKDNEENAQAVNLAFRTGTKVSLCIGEDVNLYKTERETWSLDVREHVKSKEKNFTGTIDSFEFLPTAEQEGDIYISHINIRNKKGDVMELYPHNLDIKSIKSSGEMTVYYIGNILSIPIFDIKESKDFSLEVRIEDELYVLQKGMDITLVQSEKKGYWEIGNEVDTTVYEATVDGFEFGYTGDDIVSIDYINLVLDNDENAQLTMMQTGALYAIPHGNYKKIYTYDGHDKSFTDILPDDDWGMELYYEEDAIIDLNVGAKVWVYKNEDDIWVIDPMYEEENLELAEDDA